MSICIFGFGNHSWFTPKDLRHVKKTNLLKDALICEKCKVKLQNAYRYLSNQKTLKTTSDHYSIDDFVTFNIEERLSNIHKIYQNLDITQNQWEKFEEIYYGYMDSVASAYVDPENATDSLRRKFMGLLYYHHYQNYSIPTCECCNFTVWEALTIDHVNQNKIFCLNCIIAKTLGLTCNTHNWVNVHKPMTKVEYERAYDMLVES